MAPSLPSSHPLLAQRQTSPNRRCRPPHASPYAFILFPFPLHFPVSSANLSKDQGQGGAQAIEDGIALGIALSNLPSNESNAIERRLGLFEKIRINRGSVMQIFSNAGQDDAARIRDEASKFIPADSVPSMFKFLPTPPCPFPVIFNHLSCIASL
jgi:hypothetical protein